MNVKAKIVIALFMNVAGVIAVQAQNHVGHDFVPNQDEATIYFFREWGFVSGGVSYNIIVNDELVGVSKNGSVISIRTKPGLHDLWTTPAGIKELYVSSHKEVVLEKGKNYFYEVDVRSKDILYGKDETYSKSKIQKISD